MTKKHFIEIATILGRWKSKLPLNIYNGIEQNFVDMLLKENKLFDEDKFIDYIDKIDKEWNA